MLIELTQGKEAIVDAQWHEMLSATKWHHAKVRGETGYAVTNKPGCSGVEYMHRVIIDAPSNLQVDHINGDTLDNRKQNLRLCTHRQNQMNRKKSRRKNLTSEYKGVYWCKFSRKWYAQICVHKKSVKLSSHDSEIEAALAYNKAAIEYFGEFARLNVIQEPTNEHI